MEFTKEQLIEIEQLSSAFMKIDEIALILDCNEKQFRFEALKIGSQVNRAYNRGKLKSIATIQESVVKMAQMGSPQAQKDVGSLITAQRKNER